MWLARGRQGIWPRQDAGSWGERIAQLSWDHVPDFRPLLGVTVAMFLTVHGWYRVLEYRAKPQTKPAFEVLAQGGTGNEKQEFAGDVWAQLGATEGESLVRRDGSAPMGMVSASHLFWRPSAMSRTALHHRPDVCMPGSGWKSEGEVGETTVEVSGHPLKFVVFRFSREEKTGRRVQALMLWGVWRNGQPVPFDFSDKLTALPEKYGMWPTDRHMLGIELVSVMVPYEQGSPPLELARAAVPKMFQYKPVVIEGNRGGNP